MTTLIPRAGVSASCWLGIKSVPPPPLPSRAVGKWRVSGSSLRERRHPIQVLFPPIVVRSIVFLPRLLPPHSGSSEQPAAAPLTLVWAEKGETFAILSFISFYSHASVPQGGQNREYLLILQKGNLRPRGVERPTQDH